MRNQHGITMAFVVAAAVSLAAAPTAYADPQDGSQQCSDQQNTEAQGADKQCQQQPGLGMPDRPNNNGNQQDPNQKPISQVGYMYLVNGVPTCFHNWDVGVGDGPRHAASDLLTLTRIYPASCSRRGTFADFYVVSAVDRDEAVKSAVAAQFMHVLPVGWVEPVGISNATLFLASDEARSITGLTMTIDAGSMLKERTARECAGNRRRTVRAAVTWGRRAATLGVVTTKTSCIDPEVAARRLPEGVPGPDRVPLLALLRATPLTEERDQGSRRATSPPRAQAPVPVPRSTATRSPRSSPRSPTTTPGRRTWRGWPRRLAAAGWPLAGVDLGERPSQ